MKSGDAMYRYKESDIMNEFTNEEANLLRNSNVNINSDICELEEIVSDLMVHEGLDTEIGKVYGHILDKILELENIIDKKYTRVIFVEPDFSDGASLYAMSDLNDFQIGDEVLLKTNNDEIEGIVREVAYYTKEHLPSSPDNMYSVTEITYREEN